MEKQKNKNKSLSYILIVLVVISIILVVFQVSENLAYEFRNGILDQKYTVNNQLGEERIVEATPLPTITMDSVGDDPNDPYYDTGE